MGTKYAIHYLRSQAILVLRNLYPTKWMYYKTRDLTDEWKNSPKTDPLVISIARNLDIPEVLPTAMLDFCHRNTEDFLEVLSSDDCPVSQRDKFVLMRGRMRLLVLTGTIIRTVLQQPLPRQCHAPATCQSARLRVAWPVDDVPDFSLVQGTWGTEDEAHPVCYVCRDRLGKYYSHELRGLWKDLPAIFDLPGWDQYPSDETLTNDA